MNSSASGVKLEYLGFYRSIRIIIDTHTSAGNFSSFSVRQPDAAFTNWRHV
jgi:hypothetical protein